MGEDVLYGQTDGYMGTETGDSQVGGGTHGRNRLRLRLGHERGKDSDWI